MVQSNRKHRLSLTSTILAAAVVFGTIGAPVHALAQSNTAVQQQNLDAHAKLPEDYAAYLQNQYKIQWSGAITTAQFIDGLAQALHVDKASFSNQTTNQADTKLTLQAAVSLSVKAAGLAELAHTYPAEKAAKVLTQAKVNAASLTPEAAQELAAAIDTGLLPAAYADALSSTQQVTADVASLLVGKVLSFKGDYKNYLGYTSDEDIYGKLYHAWESSNLIDAPELRQVVDEALKQNLVTGYNLKDLRYNANFDSKRSISYGHSDITHAIQLVGLLRSEGFEAKVQLEPKTSAYIYLKEWGEPKETSDFKVVPLGNGNYIAYAKEYDLNLEFVDEADKALFDGLISRYAKKNEENPKGLLYESWWQPLYSSNTELKGYPVITNNFITKGNYLAQSYSLNDKSAAVVAGFKKLDPSSNITSYTFWVDQPFYHYLLGDYK